ncbi:MULTISPECIES: hypothetical protein [unclassified Oleiphilus]|uniref:hypothetical protein n=1 Tax=unclassified Oleiphilus TaxID=2631174 RepID=UPI0007C287F8|nr:MULTISPECIES: hypothetical protein [unclassified Oleiphilus]KZY37730.1 hypothetical protein A3729_16405 [Oleiphilus sp. HI0043]KZZ67911.1 hypothetical protein A3763_15250 [Oleiphilus sp. HI0128]
MQNEKTSNFINKARSVHGEKYEYEESDYIKSAIKLTVTCPEHGNFSITPNNHLRGKGCAECGKGKSRLARLKTVDKFLSKANEVHGVRYNYSKINYKDTHTKVEIICKDHGAFLQAPQKHMAGQGCPSCARNYLSELFNSDMSQFVEKAKAVHADKFDYSEATYVNSKTPIRIICPIHGVFDQDPTTHLNSNGCPQCGKLMAAKKKTKDTEWFIEQATLVHGNNYQYDQSQYKSIKTPLTICCPLHGTFEQTPDKHIQGQGCPQCKWVKISKANTSTTNEFIHKAHLVHEDRYSYDKVDYRSAKDNVIITCHLHGDFEQTPDSHLTGAGCKVCAGIPDIDTAEFIKRAREIHGDKYSYENSEYKSAKTNVRIACPIHGEYGQAPNNHLTGAGCPLCSRIKKHLISVIDSELRDDPMNCYYIEFIGTTKHFWKVGVSTNSIFERYRSSNLERDQLKIAHYEELPTTAYKALLYEVYWMIHMEKYSGRSQGFLEYSGGGTETFTTDISNGLSLADMLNMAVGEWGHLNKSNLQNLPITSWHIKQKLT